MEKHVFIRSTFLKITGFGGNNQLGCTSTGLAVLPDVSRGSRHTDYGGF